MSSNNYNIKVNLKGIWIYCSSSFSSYYEWKKRKRAVFVFSWQIQQIRKIKDVLSWQLRKKPRNNLTRLNKTHHRKGEHQTESKPADDGEEMQTRHLRLCLSARISVCLHTCLSVNLSTFHSTCSAKQWHLSCISAASTVASSYSHGAISCHVVTRNLFLHSDAQ